MHLGDIDGCGCQGLSGMGDIDGLGFTDSTLVEQPAQQQTWWQRAIEEVTKLIPRTPTSYPIYTPPGYPTSYPGTYEGYAPQETDWTPYLVGGLVLFALMRRK